MRRAALLVLLAGAAKALTAQAPDGAPVGFRGAIERCGNAGERACAQDAKLAPVSAPPSAIILSALLPGAGQALLDVNRALPYLAVEAFAWTSYVRHSQQYRRQRDGYRGIAARVARAAFSALTPHGDFAYYERMSHYRESGRFDTDAGVGLQPETDTTTYNGAVWLLARRTYWLDPLVAPDRESAAWQRAEGFYRSRAYDETYRWSWSGAPDEYDRFQSLIDDSNEANRRALFDLGVIIANHALSMVDAYVTIRLRRGMAPASFTVDASVPFPRTGGGRGRGT